MSSNSDPGDGEAPPPPEPADDQAEDQADDQAEDQAEDQADDSPSPARLRRVPAQYCDQCDVPIAYCRFFGHSRDDDDWEALPVYGSQKPAKAVRDSPKPNVTVTVKARTKRKNTTTITNLEAWEIDTREFGKALSKRMAIGSSTKQTATGIAVVIQGDAGQAVIEILTGQYRVPKTCITATRKVKKTPESESAKHQPPPQRGLPGDGSDSGSSDDDAPPPPPPEPEAPQTARRAKGGDTSARADARGGRGGRGGGADAGGARGGRGGGADGGGGKGGRDGGGDGGGKGGRGGGADGGGGKGGRDAGGDGGGKGGRGGGADGGRGGRGGGRGKRH